MPQSELRLIQSALKYLPKSEIKQISRQTRGLYVLYHQLNSVLNRVSEEICSPDASYVTGQTINVDGGARLD